MEFNSWNIFWSLCFGLLATLIIVGNVLTIWIFLKRRLRKRAHFLLISLAVADLLVGLLAVPLFMVVNTKLRTALSVYYIQTCADVFTGLTSIFTLAVISLERMYAIGWPFRHRTLKRRFYMFAIVMPWILAAIFTSVVLLRFFSLMSRDCFLSLLALFQATPLLVMCAAYFVIWRKHKSPMFNQNHVRRETRLAKTLFLITGTSLLTWLPFQILNLLFLLIPIWNFPYIGVTVFVIKSLQFSNSLVNVIIYPFRISEFKNALLQMFQCCCVSPSQPVCIAVGNRGQVDPCQELHISQSLANIRSLQDASVDRRDNQSTASI